MSKPVWEIEPHYCSDYDVLDVDDLDAWDQLIQVVEHVYDNMEAGEERTITIRFNGPRTAPGKSEQPACKPLMHIFWAQGEPCCCGAVPWGQPSNSDPTKWDGPTHICIDNKMHLGAKERCSRCPTVETASTPEEMVQFDRYIAEVNERRIAEAPCTGEHDLWAEWNPQYIARMLDDIADRDGPCGLLKADEVAYLRAASSLLTNSNEGE